MSDNPFVHLHVHTEYSLLDGLSRIDDLVNRAKALNMPALAITDHGAMFGVIEFFKACRKAGIKPIIGMEAYLARRSRHDRDAKLDKRPFHMLLLAQNLTGYGNLMKLASKAQLEGYYYRPRIDWDLLQDCSEGIIATSGCLAAQIPSLISEGKDDEAKAMIGRYQEIFKDRFFLELQQHDIPELVTLNKWLVEYRKSGHTNVPLVATNDVHYIMAEDFDPHDTLLCIQTGALKSEAERMRMTDPSYHLTSADEMWAFFGDIAPEALHNTLTIADMCDVDLSDKHYHLPVFPVPDGFDSGTYLRYLCDKGLQWRYGDDATSAEVQARIDRELSTIATMGFNTYFLIVWDLCQFATHADIWWNVRGSGAGSLAAYSLGITNIDPLQNNLLFERFLNIGRVSMPDIDMDFPDDRREEMINYCARKYGEDKVAAIITFGTLGPKAAVRDIGRAMGVNLDEVNKAAKLIPSEPKPKKIMEYVEDNPELNHIYQTNDTMRRVIDMAKSLQGVNRHVSTHAAGIIVADKPLVSYIPLHRPTKGDENSQSSLKSVTQFPMETCEELGLLKIDFLGLSTLTIMRRACELIERYHGIKYTLYNIPYRSVGDPERDHALKQAFDMIGRGETVGVFQVESSGMQQMLRDMRPFKFEHIIAAVALYRPGPMDFIPTYNKRLHGDETVAYKHPLLESILAETYGIIVYQEQLMQIAGELFGYELGEADLMRRAVSKKKEKDLKQHREIFMQRGPEHGLDAETASKIFDDIEFFANYGFNKSHAADYAVITCQTAYLKCHYPHEYLTALLSTHRDDIAKITTFLGESRRLNIPILPPDVNYSQLDFDIQPQANGTRGIRIGLVAIKNAGESALWPILSTRAAGGIFTSLEDFCRRVDLRTVGKRTLESLAKVGALTSFGSRNQIIHNLDRILKYSTDHHQAMEVGQISLFGNMGDAGDELTLMKADEVDSRQEQDWEKELLGIRVSGRPTDKFRDLLQYANTIEILEYKQAQEEGEAVNQKPAVMAGEVLALRKIPTKNGDMMGIVTLEDWHDSAASIEAVLFPKTWVKFGELVAEGKVLIFGGKLDTGRGDLQMIVENVRENANIVKPEDDYVPSPAATNLSSWQDEPAPFSDEEIANLVVPEEETTTHQPHKPAAVAPPAPQPPPNSDWREAPPDLDPIDLNDFSYGEPPPPPPKWVVVYFQRGEDVGKDTRRLQRLHSLFTTYHGQDRFSIVIEGDEPMYFDFPSQTTGYNPTLHSALAQLVGEEKIQVWDSP